MSPELLVKAVFVIFGNPCIIVEVGAVGYKLCSDFLFFVIVFMLQMVLPASEQIVVLVFDVVYYQIRVVLYIGRILKRVLALDLPLFVDQPLPVVDHSGS